MARGDHRSGNGNSGDRHGDHDRRHHRRPYVSPYGPGVPYGPGYGVFGPIDPYPLGYPDTGSSDDSAAAPDQPSTGGYDARSDEQDQPPARVPYNYAPAFSAPSPSPAPQSEEAVTLIFKDGRPAEQIHNYILTRSTLFIGDKERREIPTDQLDLAATAKANQDAGNDFRLPDTSR